MKIRGFFGNDIKKEFLHGNGGTFFNP